MSAGFYARACTSADGTFSAGPFPSLADALDEAPGILGLADGDTFEVGEWQTMTARISAESYLMLLFKSLTERYPGVADGWCQSVAEIPSADLDNALDLAFQGWLTRHAAHPAFGMVGKLTTGICGG